MNPARYTAFGLGCTGSAGVPILAAIPGHLPWIGNSYGVRLTSIPNAAPSVVFFGASRTAWSPISLPFPLGTFGMPGCTLLVSGDVILGIPTSSNGGTLSMNVPGSPALVGRAFYNQAFVMDVFANPAGVTASNAGEALVGSK